MAFLNRLWAVLPSFGSPVQNDTLFVKQNNVIAAAATTTVTLSSLAPVFSKGYVRVKIYEGVVATGTITNIQVILSDGSQFVNVGETTPIGTGGVLAIVPTGTAIGGANGSITNGAAVLTSVSAPFTPAMVGLPIALSNAAAGGGVLFAYILSYQSATQVTIDRNAGATTTTATMTLTGQYGNAGVLGTSVAGLDILYPFEVDMAASQVSVLTTITGATATCLEDIEVSTTS